MSLYLWILSFGHLVVDLGQGILPILTPILAQNFHLSYSQVGMIALASTFSSAIIQPIFGVMSDRFSMPWIMPLGLLLSGFGLALTGRVHSFAMLLVLILISGLGVAGYHPEGSKMAHFISEDSKAGASMSIFAVGGNLGFGLGPMLGMFVLSFDGLNSIEGVMIPGILASILFLILLPKFKKFLAQNLSEHSKPERTAVGKNRKGSLIFLLLYVTVRSWIQSGLIYFIPFYFPSFKGIDNPEYLISTFLIAGAVGTILGGTFADRFGGRNGLLVSMLLTLLTIYPFLHLNGMLLPLIAFIMGVSLISTFSTTVVFGQRLLPENIGLASGLLLGFGVGMGSIGVTFLGMIADHFGLPLTMNIISVLPVIGILLAITLPDVRARESVAKVA